MKYNVCTIKKSIPCFLAKTVLIIGSAQLTDAQHSGINEAIEKNRKGDLTVKARPGDKITIEQLKHEFWFGCAISSSLAGGRWSENDRNQYREKFLENFNSAVTENAVKWGSMEPRRGEVNYSVIDSILAWTEKNQIPLRAHNLFWGIPKFVQQWVKNLDDNELRQTLQNRAETVTSRYKGRFAEYDLNNEMIHGNYYEDRLGPDITKLMAQRAHNGDPDAKLFLNDYDILTGNMLDAYMAHIRKLLTLEVLRSCGLALATEALAKAGSLAVLQSCRSCSPSGCRWPVYFDYLCPGTGQ